VWAGLQAEVDEWHAEVEKKVEELATRHQLPQDEVQATMLFSSKLKKGRVYHEFNAKVWRRTAELNEGKSLIIRLAFILTRFVGKVAGERLTLDDVRVFVQNEAADAWSAEELAQLKINYEEYKAAKEAGTRRSNSVCAADAITTGEKLFEEVSGSGGS
jgi:hypothetical protein